MQKHCAVFLEKATHYQSDKHWNHFNGNIEEMSEIWCGAHNIGFSKCIDTLLNWTNPT